MPLDTQLDLLREIRDVLKLTKPSDRNELFNAPLDTDTVGTLDDGVTWQDVVDKYDRLEISLLTPTGDLLSGVAFIENLQEGQNITVGFTASVHATFGSTQDTLSLQDGEFHFQTNNTTNAANLVIWGVKY